MKLSELQNSVDFLKKGAKIQILKACKIEEQKIQQIIQTLENISQEILKQFILKQNQSNFEQKKHDQVNEYVIQESNFGNQKINDECNNNSNIQVNEEKISDTFQNDENDEEEDSQSQSEEDNNQEQSIDEKSNNNSNSQVNDDKISNTLQNAEEEDSEQQGDQDQISDGFQNDVEDDSKNWIDVDNSKDQIEEDESHKNKKNRKQKVHFDLIQFGAQKDEEDDQDEFNSSDKSEENDSDENQENENLSDSDDLTEKSDLKQKIIFEQVLSKLQKIEKIVSQHKIETQLQSNQNFKQYIEEQRTIQIKEQEIFQNESFNFYDEILKDLKDNLINFFSSILQILDEFSEISIGQIQTQILKCVSKFKSTVTIFLNFNIIKDRSNAFLQYYKWILEQLELISNVISLTQYLQIDDLNDRQYNLKIQKKIEEDVLEKISILMFPVESNDEMQSFELYGIKQSNQFLLMCQLVKSLDINEAENSNYNEQKLSGLDSKVRKCLVYQIIRMANQQKEQYIITYSQNLLIDFWVQEKDQSVRNFIKNKEMIDFQKKLFSKDLKSINQKLMDSARVKLTEITELENKLKQQVSIFIREEKKEEIEKKYQELENFLMNIQDMSQKMDLTFPFLIEIRKELSLIKQKVENLQKTVNNIARDITLLRGKSFQDLLDIRKNTVLQNKKLNDFQNIYIPIYCQKVNPVTGIKLNEKTPIFFEDQNNFEAEINEFLWKEQRTKDVLLIHGIAGSGKTTLARKIEEFLWGLHDWNKKETFIPIFISLPSLEEPRFNLVDLILQSDIFKFDKIQIQEFKNSISNQRLIFILDGYDELNSNYIQQNLFNTNRMEKNWKDSRLIYTTRSEVLIPNLYQQWFQGKKNDMLKEVELQPFTEIEQKKYVEEFSILNLKLKIQFKYFTKSLAIFIIYLFLIDVKQILQCYTYQLEQKTMNYKQFEQLWQKIKSQQLKEGDQNLLDEDHAKEIIRKIQDYVKENCQLQFVELQINLEKEIKELWSSKKFESSISFLGLRPLLISPFMLQIVVSVLPNTTAYYSEINRIKEHFISKFIELKQTQKLISSYKNQTQIQQHLDINENQLSIYANKLWEKLEEQEYFKDFSILNQIKQPQNFGNEDQQIVYMAIKQQNLKMFDFYVAFVQFYQNNQIKRLSEQGKIQDEENFRKELNLFQQALALEMTQKELPLVNYQKKGKLRLDEDNSEINDNDSWMDKYFDDSNEGNNKKLLRKGSLLIQKDFIDFLPKIDFDQVSKIFDKLFQQIKKNGKQKFNSLNELTENKNFDLKQETSNNSNLLQFIKIVEKSKFSNLNFSLQSFYGILKFIIDEIRMKQKSEAKLLVIIRLSSLLFNFIRISSNGLYLYTQIYGVLNQINLEQIEIEGINIQGCSCYKVNLNETQFQSVNISQCAFNASKIQGVNWNNLICSEQPKFDGHEHMVYSIVFSPDGKILISSGRYDKTIRLWDVNQETQLVRLDTNHGAVMQLAFSQDGQFWASAHGSDGIVMLWKLNQSQAVKVFSEHNGEVNTLAFSSFGKILASGGGDRVDTICSISGHEGYIMSLVFQPILNLLASGGKDKIIRIWDIQEKKEIKQLQGHTDVIRSLSFHPNNNTLASGSLDETIRLWDIKEQKVIMKIDQSIGKIWTIQFSPDGNTLASGGSDCIIRLWDASASKEIQKFEGHTNGIRCVIFSPDGQKLASGSNDKSIRLWNVHGGRNKLNGHSDWVNCIQISPDGLHIASGEGDQLIKLWDLKGGIEIRRFIGHSNFVSSLCFSQNGQYLVSGGDEIVILWDLNSSQEIRRFIGHQYQIIDVKISPDLNIIASCDDKIIIWDLYNSEKYICILNGHTDWIWSIEFSPDGQLLASGGEDNLIKIWDWKQQQEVYQLNGHTNELRLVIFFSNGLRLASCGKDKTIRIWDIKEQKEIFKLIGHSMTVVDMKFTMNEQQLVSCSTDMTIRFWNLINKQEILRILTHSDLIRRVAISPNQKQLISCSFDKTIKLWDIEGHKGYQSDIGHKNEIMCIVFSPNGQKLASCSKDKSIRVYHVKERKQILKLEGHKDQVFQIIFTSNQLISCSQDNSIKLWDIIRGHEIKNIWLNSYARSIDSFNQNFLACGCKDGSILIWDITDTQNINQKLKMVGHTKIITSIVFSPKEDILASGSYDQQIIIWNYLAGQIVKKWNSNQEFIQKIIFSPNGQNIIFTCQDAFIRVWNTQMKDQKITLKGHKDIVFSIEFSQFGLISGSKDRSIRFWNIELALEIFKQDLDQESICLAYNSKEKYIAYATTDQSIVIGESFCYEKVILKEHKQSVESVAFSSDGMKLASASPVEKIIVIWDVKTQKRISSLDAEQVFKVQFMPHGKYIVSGGFDNLVRLFDLDTKQQVKIFTGHTNRVFSITISPDGSNIVSGSIDQSIIFWNVENEDEQHIQTESQVNVVRFSNQGYQLAVGMGESQIIIFDSNTKKVKKRLKEQNGEIMTLAFSPNDLILASGNGNKIILWDIQNGQIIRSLEGHSDLILSLQFQPNRNIIAACSRDKTIRFWDLNFQENIELIKQEQSQEILSIAFSPDGKILALGGQDGNVKLWNTNPHTEYHTFFCSQSQKALISLSADEQILAIEYIDGSVRIFNTSEDREIQKIFLQNVEILSLCISLDGMQLATGFREKCIRKNLEYIRYKIY